jgi:hypothetical protein
LLHWRLQYCIAAIYLAICGTDAEFLRKRGLSKWVGKGACVCLCYLEIWGFLRVLEKWQAPLLGWSSQWRFHCLLPSCSRCCTSSINNLPSSCLLCLCGNIQGTHVTVFMGVFSFLDDLNAICFASVLVLTVSTLEVFFLQKTGISVFLGLRRFSPSAVVCSESSVEQFCKVLAFRVLGGKKSLAS